MRRSERADLALSYVEKHNFLRRGGFKLLVRAKGLEPVGLITQVEKEWSPRFNDNRELASGLKLNEDKPEEFAEYLDWITPEGHLEPCKCMENGIVVITARDGFNVEDDPDNFTWLTDREMTRTVECPSEDCDETLTTKTNFTFRDSDLFKRVTERMKRLRTERNDIKEELSTVKAEKIQAEADARESSGVKQRLEEDFEKLQEEVSSLKSQNEYYESLLPEWLIKITEESEASKERLEQAGSRGRFEGMDKLDKARTVLSDLSELEDQRAEVEGRPEGARALERLERGVTSSMEKIEKRIGELEEQVAAVRGEKFGGRASE